MVVRKKLRRQGRELSAALEVFDASAWPGRCVHEQAAAYHAAMREHVAGWSLTDAREWLSATARGYAVRLQAAQTACKETHR